MSIKLRGHLTAAHVQRYYKMIKLSSCVNYVISSLVFILGVNFRCIIPSIILHSLHWARISTLIHLSNFDMMVRCCETDLACTLCSFCVYVVSLIFPHQVIPSDDEEPRPTSRISNLRPFPIRGTALAPELSSIVISHHLLISPLASWFVIFTASEIFTTLCNMTIE